MTRQETWALTIARMILGGVLLYFGLLELQLPSPWVGNLPSILPHAWGVPVIELHGFVLFVLGVDVAIGFGLRWAIPGAFLVLLGVVGDLALISGFSEILARDIGLVALSVAVWATKDRGFTLDALVSSDRKAFSLTQSVHSPQ